MDKNQEIFEIGKLVLQLTLAVSADADLDRLMERLFGVLDNVAGIRTRRKGALLLFNARDVLVQVAGYGLRKVSIDRPELSEIDGLAPEVRPEAYLTSTRAERGSLPEGETDEHFLVLSLYDNARPLGQALVFIDPDWQPGEAEFQFMTDLAQALSGLVSRCVVNEILRLRELELEDARADAIRQLGRASEYRDNETGMHVIRMTNFAMAIARAMNLTEAQRDMLYITAPMHDVGKIGISDTILFKPGRLTDEEFRKMKDHTVIGGRILKGDDELIIVARDIAMCHHEHWDGSGYPNGLRGEEIPILARICAVADVFDALISDRPYKKAWTVEDTVDWIRGQSGKQFDPATIAAFDRALPEILRIRQLYRDDIIDPREVLDLPEPTRRENVWVQWDDGLSVGIYAIDQHHRYLVELVNDLYDAVVGKKGARQTGIVLRSLRRYAEIHFRAEESMMEHYGFAGLERQKGQHHHFEQKITEFRDELHTHPITTQREMLVYLRDWLIRHIRVEDAQLRSLVDGTQKLDAVA